MDMGLDLVKITDLVSKLGISSRSLRYYEQMSLIQSIRMDLEKYRYITKDIWDDLEALGGGFNVTLGVANFRVRF